MSISQVIGEMPDLRRYRLVVIDESHNLRNREGKRYRAIQEYIKANESKCILLTATPYNKTYLDLSNQLRRFVLEDKDLGIRPEKQLRDLGETEFIRRHQCSVRSLAAFEKSEQADDWRELMRLYLARRTRSLNGTSRSSSRETWFTLAKREHVKPVIAALSSDIFWWWYTISSNLRDLNPYDIQNFPLPESALADSDLRALGERYLKDLDKNSTMLIREQKQTGTTETQSFKIQKSKSILDQIDRVLAAHYGFTDEELDFIINYDIKYRMGRDPENEAD